MNLIGTPLLVLVVIVAVALPVLAVLVWPRIRGPRRLQWTQRIGLLVCCQLAAVLAAAVVLNDEFDYFSSWGSLVGAGSHTAPVIRVVPPGPHDLTGTSLSAGHAAVDQGGR